jgi:hypothetical protein
MKLSQESVSTLRHVAHDVQNAKGTKVGGETRISSESTVESLQRQVDELTKKLTFVADLLLANSEHSDQ